MFAFFDSLVGFLSTVITYVVNFFSSLFYFIGMAAKSSGYLLGCIALLPPFLSTFLVAIVSISVIMQIINHGG